MYNNLICLIPIRNRLFQNCSWSSYSDFNRLYMQVGPVQRWKLACRTKARMSSVLLDETPLRPNVSTDSRKVRNEGPWLVCRVRQRRHIDLEMPAGSKLHQKYSSTRNNKYRVSSVIASSKVCRSLSCYRCSHKDGASWNGVPGLVLRKVTLKNK